LRTHCEYWERANPARLEIDLFGCLVLTAVFLALGIAFAIRGIARAIAPRHAAKEARHRSIVGPAIDSACS
jgi:hypothetical protein